MAYRMLTVALTAVINRLRSVSGSPWVPSADSALMMPAGANPPQRKRRAAGAELTSAASIRSSRFGQITFGRPISAMGISSSGPCSAEASRAMIQGPVISGRS